MPTLTDARKSNEEHFASGDSDDSTKFPVAVFIGGTSGVGEAMIAAFCRYNEGKAHIVVVGRNKVAGDRILDGLPKPKNPVERLFISCDVSLMRNVREMTSQIKAKFTKINYLVLSTGLLNLNERLETAEGLEVRLAVSYYSRWLEIRELVGLVEAANVQDGLGRGVVVSILAPGHGAEVDPSDWEIKNNYSPGKVIATAVTYNDLMVEAWATRYPTVPFVHAHPGLVRTPIFSRSPSYVVKFVGLLLVTLGRFMTVSAEESANWMWYTINLTHTRTTAIKNAENGAESALLSWRTDPYGKDKGKEGKYFGDLEKAEGLWKHSEEAIESSLRRKFDS